MQEPYQTNNDSDQLGSLYLTNFSIYSSEEDFRFLLNSANLKKAYSCSPKHAKRIFLLLKSKIEDYEKKHGSLKTDLPKSAVVHHSKQTKKVGFGVHIADDVKTHVNKKESK